jgi:hypothetical protein
MENYPDVMEVCEFYDLVKLTNIKKDYNDELVMQFSSTVHFHPDEPRTLTWMSVGQVCLRTLAEFAVLLGYTVKDKREPEYRRIHAPKSTYHCHPYLHVAYPPTMVKEMLQILYL